MVEIRTVRFVNVTIFSVQYCEVQFREYVKLFFPLENSELIWLELCLGVPLILKKKICSGKKY